jgi:hypothetical protein
MDGWMAMMMIAVASKSLVDFSLILVELHYNRDEFKK